MRSLDLDCVKYADLRIPIQRQMVKYQPKKLVDSNILVGPKHWCWSMGNVRRNQMLR